MNRTELKKRAKDALNGNWGTAIVAMLIFMVASSILSSIGVGFLVMGLLNVGYFSCFLSLLRYRSASLEGCVSAITDNIGPKFVATLLVMLYTFLWSLLFVIPGIVKAYSYSMAYYIKCDNPTFTATQAIDESRRIMNGNKWRLFCLHLSFLGWIIVGALCCGIGVLWVNAYMKDAEAEFS